MKQRLLFLAAISIAILLFSCKNNSIPDDASKVIEQMVMDTAKIKTLTIKYETLTSQGDIITEGKLAKWIDVTNRRIAVEVVSQEDRDDAESGSRQVSIIKNGQSWVLNYDDRTGFSAPQAQLPMEIQDEFIRSYTDETFRQYLEETGGRILKNERILGKDCVVIEISDMTGNPENNIKIWYYHGIPLKHISAGYSMEAISIEENTPISGDVFDIPDDFEIVPM